MIEINNRKISQDVSPYVIAELSANISNPPIKSITSIIGAIQIFW